ncbi:MAG: hypothetical protein EZS28_007268 [Streblomastix strix]|uniref:Uncharacterized protein n=1 Tax=Streblomastix strix TaxID=222440 RepID=A0A5J4WRL4_9EUKA|nr:MAG: hypothetical protein EZS28_007268 [Streblomastix strix]
MGKQGEQEDEDGEILKKMQRSIETGKIGVSLQEQVMNETKLVIEGKGQVNEDREIRVMQKIEKEMEMRIKEKKEKEEEDERKRLKKLRKEK